MNALLVYIICYLSVRLICLSEGQMLGAWRYRFQLLAHIGLVVLLFDAITLNVLFLLGAITLIDTGLYLVECRLKRSSSMARALTLLLGLAAGVVLTDPGFAKSGLSFEILALGPIQIYCFLASVLLCLKESNFVIRWFFQHYKLIEKVEAEDDAPATANGRIIGNLERLLLLCFLWEGSVVAATFIVAVKGLARFKKMEEHQAFAEYVIIGTFLSVLVTLLIYQFSRLLILLGSS